MTELNGKIDAAFLWDYEVTWEDRYVIFHLGFPTKWGRFKYCVRYPIEWIKWLLFYRKYKKERF